MATRATCLGCDLPRSGPGFGAISRVQRGWSQDENAPQRGGRDPWRIKSFDVVSKVDRQEVDNALNQAAKELSTRFDFRGTDTTIAWKGEEAIDDRQSTEERVKAAIDVFKEKLIRRDI